MSTQSIELNIRLDVVDDDNSAQAINSRESQALAVLGTCFHHRADFFVDGVTVPRLVAALDAESWDGARLHQLAEQLHQAYIAVFYPAQGLGELVGPGAAAWGAFDLAQFKRLDTDCAMAEAFGFAWDESNSIKAYKQRALA